MLDPCGTNESNTHPFSLGGSANRAFVGSTGIEFFLFGIVGSVIIIGAAYTIFLSIVECR